MAGEGGAMREGFCGVRAECDMIELSGGGHLLLLYVEFILGLKPH